ncbi:MAG: hypothetical protein KDE35_14635 [Geminicoccaceae bacterium]|nr:hypothetical protein [Geminicoccaceae bacterium]
MAYTTSGLSALSYANGFTLWHYRTTDLVATVDNAGYFDEAATMLRVGDFLFVNTGIGTAPAHGVMVVVSNDAAGVDVSNVTAFGSIDSD